MPRAHFAAPCRLATLAPAWWHEAAGPDGVRRRSLDAPSAGHRGLALASVRVGPHPGPPTTLAGRHRLVGATTPHLQPAGRHQRRAEPRRHRADRSRNFPEPISVLAFGFLCNVCYTGGWLVELVVRRA